MKANDKYLKAFFEEKDLQAECFTIEHKEQLHLVESEAVIDLIKTSNDEEKQKIVDTLRKIDFTNGNVIHYLKHLATGYVKTNY